jgi:hypothetical protein
MIQPPLNKKNGKGFLSSGELQFQHFRANVQRALPLLNQYLFVKPKDSIILLATIQPNIG